MFLIDCGTYPFDILVALGVPPEKLPAKIRRLKLLKEVDQDFIDSYDFSESKGTSIQFTTGAMLIYCEQLPVTPHWKGLLAHEILHSTFQLMRHIGIVHGHKSEEAYTYLNQYITTQIYLRLDETGAPKRKSSKAN